MELFVLKTYQEQHEPCNMITFIKKLLLCKKGLFSCDLISLVDMNECEK